jgi:enoyl-CoA hydratase
VTGTVPVSCAVWLTEVLRRGHPQVDYSTIRLEHEDAVAWLVLDRPEKRNAINGVMLDEIAHALDGISREASTRVVVIRGEGPCFSAGYDIGTAYVSQLDNRDSMEEWADLRSRIDRLLRIWDCEVPVIAAVHGYCLMGATQLCALCDLILVADDARIGSVAVGIGAGYVSPVYALTVGIRRAKELTFDPGRQMSGTEAVAWGWANRGVAPDRLLGETRDLARRIATVPRELLTANKIAINRVAEMQGLRTAIRQVADIDVIAHRSRSTDSALSALRENGPAHIPNPVNQSRQDRHQ